MPLLSLEGFENPIRRLVLPAYAEASCFIFAKLVKGFAQAGRPMGTLATC